MSAPSGTGPTSHDPELAQIRSGSQSQPIRKLPVLIGAKPEMPVRAQDAQRRPGRWHVPQSLNRRKIPDFARDTAVAPPSASRKIASSRTGAPSMTAPIGSASALPVEPDVFEAPAVVDAVDHHRQALDVGLPAGRGAVVKDDRPGAVLLQLAVDLPDQLLALLADRAPSIAGRTACRARDCSSRCMLRSGAAGVVLVELLVGIVDAAAGTVERRPCSPCGSPSECQLAVSIGSSSAVDIDLLQLVDQDDRRIAEIGDVAGRHA